MLPDLFFKISFFSEKENELKKGQKGIGRTLTSGLLWSMLDIVIAWTRFVAAEKRKRDCLGILKMDPIGPAEFLNMR